LHLAITRIVPQLLNKLEDLREPGGGYRMAP
jgi:hypothetical protein